jgi:hypothetical protein
MGAATHLWWVAIAPPAFYLLRFVLALILCRKATRDGVDVELELGMSRLHVVMKVPGQVARDSEAPE